jgi:hypothetical protein
VATKIDSIIFSPPKIWDFYRLHSDSIPTTAIFLLRPRRQNSSINTRRIDHHPQDRQNEPKGCGLGGTNLPEQD